MSKTSLSIQMLEILYSRGVVSIAELARLLETNPRNIPEYKRELECAGYVIDTVRGRYGGYALNKTCTFPAVHLTEEEREGLMQGFDYLLARNDFMRRDDFGRAIAKISAAILPANTPQEALVANRFPLAMPQEEIAERHLVLSRAIADKRAVEMGYLSLSGEESKRILHPYRLFMYNNAWFVLGHDSKSDAVRYFKLNRITEYRATAEHFRIPLTYHERDYLDEYGMRQNGEWYKVCLRLTGKAATLVLDRVYGKHQTVTREDKDATLLEAEMQNEEDILAFVLGFGPACEVLEPEWLRTRVRETAEALLAKSTPRDEN